MKLTGGTKNIFGEEYKIAVCDGGSITHSGNLYFEGNINCKGYIDCKGYINCEGNIYCKGTYYISILIYKVGFLKNKNISIGCKVRNPEEWEGFLLSNEVIETPRNSPKFGLIKACIQGALAMQKAIEATIRTKKP